MAECPGQSAAGALMTIAGGSEVAAERAAQCDDISHARAIAETASRGLEYLESRLDEVVGDRADVLCAQRAAATAVERAHQLAASFEVREDELETWVRGHAELSERVEALARRIEGGGAIAEVQGCEFALQKLSDSIIEESAARREALSSARSEAAAVRQIAEKAAAFEVTNDEQRGGLQTIPQLADDVNRLAGTVDEWRALADMRALHEALDRLIGDVLPAVEAVRCDVRELEATVRCLSESVAALHAEQHRALRYVRTDGETMTAHIEQLEGLPRDHAHAQR